MNSLELPLDRWLLRNRRGALILAAALGAIVPFVWIVIQSKGSFFGDGRFASWILFPKPSEPFAAIAEVFATLGHRGPAIVSVAVVCALVDRYLGHRYCILVLAAVGAVAANEILKTIFGPTPLQLRRFGEHATSNFPSGHVVYMTSLCGLVAWFALARGNRLIFLAMLFFIVGMGPFRVVDGAHWPSDVLAGYALGFAWTILVLVIGLPWAARSSSARTN